MPKLALDPENAAASIAVRIATIKTSEAYVRETMARYDGLKSLDALLEKAGVAEDVKKIMAKE